MRSGLVVPARLRQVHVADVCRGRLNRRLALVISVADQSEHIRELRASTAETSEPVHRSSLAAEPIKRVSAREPDRLAGLPPEFVCNRVVTELTHQQRKGLQDIVI